MPSYAPGDTLLVKDPRPWDERRHLYIVATAPDGDGLVLLPCVESRTQGTADTSCLLGAGDHPFIRHESAVNYRDSIVISEQRLDRLVTDGHATRRERLADAVLERVVEGARRSPNLDRRKKGMLPPRGQS